MPADPHVVRVNLGENSYNITIRPGLLSAAGRSLAELTGARKAAIVSDSHVAPLYLPLLQQSLEHAGFQTIAATIPAGEAHKTLATLIPVFDQLLRAKIDRSTPVIALGGGVIGDMAGFVAATILRGVPFVQVPTTLLAMVDASVGGKTGVDAAAGKNLIGAFHQPMAVLIDPQVLQTLPPREFRGGLAECIKHDIIRDADHFAVLEQSISRVLELDVELLSQLIAHNVSIKARVVEADPFEKGERAHLNFGHTFGHAIETVSQYSYSHGECVALGMIAAARASRALGMLDDASVTRIEKIIATAGLPTGGMALDPGEVVNAMSFDKKVKSGRIRFVLPDRIGHVVIRDDIDRAVIHDAVASLRR